MELETSTRLEAVKTRSLAASQLAAAKVVNPSDEHVAIRSEAGRRLGSITSFKKAEAARLNGKKGGWPKGRPRKASNGDQTTVV